MKSTKAHKPTLKKISLKIFTKTKMTARSRAYFRDLQLPLGGFYKKPNITLGIFHLDPVLVVWVFCKLLAFNLLTDGSDKGICQFPGCRFKSKLPPGHDVFL